MTNHEYSHENHGMLSAMVKMMQSSMEAAALDRKIAAEDRQCIHDAQIAERRERVESIGRVHARVDDLSEATRRIETGVGTIVEQLRQADQAMRTDITQEQQRPRFALFDGAGAKALLAAAATAAGVILAKAGWVPGWMIP